jgi:hypothetical protein
MLISTYTEMLQTPQAASMLQQMMPGEDIATATQQAITLLGSITPTQITCEFFIYNLFLGLMLSIPTAFAAKIKGRKPQQK